MCFICRTINGTESLVKSQRKAFLPVAVALYNASNEAIKLNPAAIIEYGHLAVMRSADAPHHTELLVRMTRSFFAFQRDALAFSEANERTQGREASIEIRSSFFIPSENVDMPEDERAALNVLNSSVEAVACQIAEMPAGLIRKLYNRMRSPRAQQILSILAEARSKILSTAALR